MESYNDRIGNYRVEAELGPSGSGLLIQAHHLVLPRRAIIKLVHPAFAHAQVYVLQTLREACILEAIAHPGVPVVYESGVLRDRRPWFALEVIDGATLEDVLSAGPMPALDVARLIRELADLLDHAHRRGVIHRGLRPDRIVMTPARRFPLCIPDWSEAIAHDATSHLPAAPSETGQPYVAPEMLDAELVDDRVDMFALGVIGYRALTGVLPFEADPDRDGLYVRTAQRRPDAPPELCTILDSLLALDRFDRPSASEVRSDVDWLLATISQVQRHAAVSNDGKRGNLVFDARTPGERVQLDPPRLRRPRWTPHIQPLERLEHTSSVTHSVADGRIKD